MYSHYANQSEMDWILRQIKKYEKQLEATINMRKQLLDIMNESGNYRHCYTGRQPGETYFIREQAGVGER